MNGRFPFRRFVAALLLLPSLIAADVAWAGNYVYKHASFATGNQPAAVIVADFNGDHHPDLAVTNFMDNTVSVLLGKPGGNFVSKVDYATGSSPATLVAADFNGDGKPDLAVANENAGTVSVLIGNGDGTFRSHVDYPVGYAPYGIAAADLNGDGKMDIAVADFYDESVAILINNEDGTFEVQALIPLGAAPEAIMAADFNHDGKSDLITSNNSGTVSVLLGNGDGTFSQVDSSSAGNSPALAVGDFNRDGKLDAVVANQQTSQVLLLLGNGDGSFKPPSVIVSNSFVSLVYSFAVAGDFNQDGKTDLALGGGLTLLGNGDGTFQQPIQTSGIWSYFTAADINGDHRLDLAAVGNGFNVVDVLLGNGRGSFGNTVEVSLPANNSSPTAAVVADFNGDAKLDFAVAEPGFPFATVSVYLGKGNGTFGNPITSNLPVSQPMNNSLFAGDFNGDGKPDLMVLDDQNTGFEVLVGNGNGTFQNAVDTSLSYSIVSAAVGDFNGDGEADVAVTSNGNFGNPQVSIFLSNGNGTFRLKAQYTVNFQSELIVADVNRDGKADLIAASFGSPLQTFLGKGDGTFENPIFGPSDTYNQVPAVDDFNGDGISDLAVGTYSGVAFLAGNGDGSFRSQIYSNPQLQLSGVLLAGDFDGDGHVDLVSPPSFNTGALVMTGNGDGTFQPPILYSAYGFQAKLVIGDFNSDRIPDLAIPNQLDGSNFVFLNLSPPMPMVKPPR